jgi:ABC-type phosphate/phosphonate transport system substrate-binding protein
MSKKWILLTSVLSLGSAEISQAHPLDSPDIVYIDGVPCNSACQSYMAWSRQTLSMFGQPGHRQLPHRSANAAVRRATGVGGERSKPAARARIAKRAVPIPREMPRAKVAAMQPADNAAAKSDAPPDKAGAASSSTRTIQEQVAAATALAEHVTAATAVPAPEPRDADVSSPNKIDNPVALVMARPEIESISALTGKDIAIDGRQSASSGIVRTAIVAAGAAEVQLSGSQTKAVDRLISGEVPAAVLTLVSPEAAEWFPDIAGFKIFCIPVSPRSLQARLEPTGDAATKSDTPPAKIADSPPELAANPNSRTIQEQVAAATALAEQVTASTAVPAREKKADITVGSGQSEAVLRGDAEKTTPVSPSTTDLLVALVMARPEIESISALTGRDIAIDDRQSASSGIVRTAIVAAGAAEVQLSESQTKAVDRLISGEVPAAVLTLVSPEAAEWFPDIAGFKIFCIPVSPRSLKARL